MRPDELRHLAVSRWKPPDPAARLLRINAEGRLRAAALRGRVHGQTTYMPLDSDVKYEVTARRNSATGHLACDVAILNFEQLADPPGVDAAVIRWMLSTGRELVVRVDEVLDRPTLRPAPVGGKTLLVAELEHIPAQRNSTALAAGRSPA
jgi:hypothetical protein